jgi:ribosomal protein S18 acetylase RimI-like enzyme
MTIQPTRASVIDLPPDRLLEAVEVYVAAFDRDPYMLHVLGAEDRRRAEGIRAMYHYALIEALPLVDWLVKGVIVDDGAASHGAANSGAVAGVALVFPPDTGASWPEAANAAWSRFCAFIGAEATERMDNLNEAVTLRRPDQPHFYLGDLAVNPRYQGQGHGRRLIDAVSVLSEAHPTSIGVALDTENERNVALYEHFGYRVVDHYFVDGLEIWSLFRPDRSKS